jgi:hypothetical protein
VPIIFCCLAATTAASAVASFFSCTKLSKHEVSHTDHSPSFSISTNSFVSPSLALPCSAGSSMMQAASTTSAPTLPARQQPQQQLQHQQHQYMQQPGTACAKYESLFVCYASVPILASLCQCCCCCCCCFVRNTGEYKPGSNGHVSALLCVSTAANMSAAYHMLLLLPLLSLHSAAARGLSML